jgi:hypothetical protein
MFKSRRSAETLDTAGVVRDDPPDDSGWVVGNSEIAQKLGSRKVASDGRKLADLEWKSPESGHMNRLESGYCIDL